MNLRLISLSIISLCLQACAAGLQYTKLPEETRKSVNKAEVYSLVIQDEVDFTFTESNATAAAGGGLLMAMIDSSVNKGRAVSAVDVINPLYDASEEVDFRAILGKSIYDSLNGVLPVAGAMQPASPLQWTNDQLKAKVNSLQPGEALLYVDSRYFLTSDFKSLQASLGAQLYMPAQKKSSGMPKPVYFNILMYQSDMIGNGGEESVALWAKDDAALLQTKLREAANNLAALMITDMQNIADPKCPVKGESTLQINTGTRLTPIKGKPLKVVGDRVYLRQAQTNWVYSLLNNTPAAEDPETSKSKTKKKTQKEPSNQPVVCQ